MPTTATAVRGNTRTATNGPNDRRKVSFIASLSVPFCQWYTKRSNVDKNFSQAKTQPPMSAARAHNWRGSTVVSIPSLIWHFYLLEFFFLMWAKNVEGASSTFAKDLFTSTVNQVFSSDCSFSRSSRVKLSMRIGIHVAHALVSIQQDELLQCEEFPLSFCLSQVLMTIDFVKRQKELKK